MFISFKSILGVKSNVARWGRRALATALACLACSSAPAQIIIGVQSFVSFTDFIYFEFEDQGFAEITLQRFGNVDGTISVLFFTTDITAIEGLDYIGVAQQVIFGDGESTATVIVPLLDNTLVDGQRFVGLNLSDPSPGVEIFNDFAILTIRDDESEVNSPAGQLQFTANLYQCTDFESIILPDRTAPIPEDWDRRSAPGVLVTVNRVNRREGKIAVDYRTFDLPTNGFPSVPAGFNAVSNIDYVPITGTLVFDDFQTSTNILIRIRSAGLTNVNKRFGIELFNPRPFPGEDPTQILPELGIRSVAQVQINRVGTALYEVNSTNTFTNGIAFQRAAYRVDEYRRNIRVAIVNPAALGGCTDLIFRDPNRTLGIFQAGSARATLGGNDFDIVEADQHPDYVDHMTFPGDGRIRINWPGPGTIPEGVRMLVTLTINNDSLVEFNEDIFLELRRPQGCGLMAPLGNQFISSVTILADDQPPGMVDREWNPNNVSGTPVPFNPLPGPNNTVRAVAVQPDGKSVIGGDFTAVNAIEAQNRIARLNEDGSLDTSFNTGAGADGFVSAVALYPLDALNTNHNGKVIIAGGFLSVNGEERLGVARLNADGSLDGTFNPGSGANGIVWSALVVAGGKVVIAGDFTEVNGISRNRIARLNDDGSVDTAFDPGLGADGTIWSLGLDRNTSAIRLNAGQSGGGVPEYRANVDTRANSGTISITFRPQCVPDTLKVYYGGVAIFDSGLVNEFNDIYDPVFMFCDFRDFTGPKRYVIPYGPGPSTQIEIVINEGSGDPSTVWAFDATIENSVVGERPIIGGEFETFNGFPRRGVARLNSNGTLDQNFDPGGGPNDIVYAVAVQPDLKVLIGGAFTEVDQLPRSGIARFNLNGTVDESFDPGTGFDDSVFAIAVDNNGQAMVGGVFTEFNSTRRVGLARLNTDGTLDTLYMDTAYNHFAGLINPTSYEPNNSIHTIAFQSDGKVMVGGSFRRMGGHHSIDAPRPNRYTVFHRNDIAPRHNLARLIGDWGFTANSPNTPQGPGNMAFLQSSYSVDEHGVELSARLVRSNGFLGRITAVAISTQNLATAGVDYTNAVGRFIWTAPHPPNPLVLFFRVPVIDDAVIEGDENISAALVQPSGSITLGAEVIPLGGALGRAIAPITIIDNDVDQGYFVFSAPVYNVNEGVPGGTVTVNVHRVGGSTTPVQVDFYTIPGTALDGDFRARSGTLIFGQNITNQTITITITNQPMVEPDENFFVVLTNATGSASLGFSTTDPSFDPGLGANGTVRSISFITNFVNRGRIYIGGDFTSYGGTNRGRVARIMPNGSIDSAFADPNVNGNVLATVVQPDGKLLIGGDFTAVGGTARTRIARLNTDGTLDSVFDPDATSTNLLLSTARALALNSQLFFTTNLFTNTVVTTNMVPPGSTNLVVTTNEMVITNIVTTTNDYLIAGGAFGLFRYGPDGTDDTNTYNPVLFDGPIHALAVLATNRTILVGGAFSTVNGQPGYNGLVRLLEDFTVDPTFNPVTDAGAVVRSVDVTSHGSVVIGGLFRIQNNAQINNVARLRQNGILDLAFNPGTGANDEVFKVHVQREQNFLDRVLLGGKFTSVNGRPRNHIARLHPDGRSDEGFFANPAANAPVHAIATQLDNKVLVGGEFNLFSGILRNRIARISPSIATVNIIDDDHFAGRFSFVDATFSTNENNLSATIYVQRNGGSAGQVQVTASTSAGSATPGADYQSVTTNITWVSFDPNAIKSFTVPIVGDKIVELPETVNLHLRSPTGGALLGLSNAVLVIDNDDFYGALAFSQENFETDENGGGAAITIVRTGGAAETVSAQYEVYSIDAIDGVDFVSQTNTVTFGPGQTSTNFTVAVLQDPVQDGDKLVGLRLANPVNASLGLPNPATLTIVDDESFNIPAGSVDTIFGAAAAANSPVYALALQPDGKFFIGGDFTIVNDVTRNRVARLNPNGSLDGRFNVGLGPDLPVRSMALQPDGKLVIGGFFTRVHGTNRAGVARLNRDGTLDTFFNPGAGANNPVYSVALDAIGRIFIGGAFDRVAAAQRSGIALLNTNGTLNTGFDPGTGVNGTVYAIAVQADGKVVIGGEFDLVNNVSRVRLARLNPDGSVDDTFNPGAAGLDAAVRTIALQADRKILIGGSFTTVDGTPRNYLARLHPDGSLDTAFFGTDQGANNAVYALAVQADGKILVGGDFTVFHGRNRNRITRLLPDGKLDPTINFGTGANSFVAAFAIQPDRRIIFGGGFTTYDDQPRGYFARIYGGAISGSGAFEFISPFFVAVENAQKALVTVRRRGGTAGQTTIDYQTVDVTALAGLDYTAIDPTTLFFSEGEAVQTVEVPILDDTIVEDPEFFGMYLSSPTGGADLGGQPSATVTIVNNDSIISFLSPTFNVSESNLSALATITVLRSGATNTAVSVDYLTSDGTALAGFDYRSRSDTITFGPNELVKKFTVPIIDDALVEGNETVNLALTNVTGAVSLGAATAELVIVDNDFAAGQFVFSSPVYVVNEYETNIVITVIRTNGTTGIVSVDYATSDGLARAILDYFPVADTLSFADGESIKTFSIPIVPDHLDETNETVIIALSNPRGGATLGGTSTAVLTILNSQLVNGNLNFSQPVYTVNESNITATLTVTRTLGNSGPVSVNYRTVDGAAIGGSDYVTLTSAVSWSDGDTAPKTFTVTIIDDLLVESVEDFAVELFNPSGGATLGTTPRATVNIVDADTGPGNLGFTAGNYFVSENSTNAVLDVVRNFGSTGTVTIAYAVVPGGTAVSGVHYSNVTGVLSFGPGVTNLSVAVPIIDNFIVEVDRTFKVELSSPTGGASTNGRIISTIVTIVENDQEAGSLDLSFNNLGANDQIYSILIQTNSNKLFIGGDFTQFSGVARSRIARLQPNGTLDGSFDAGGVISNSVRALAAQPDGKVIVGGAFTGVSISSNAAVHYLTRLHIDGMVDTNFFGGGLAGVDNFVYAIAIQNDNRILAGGAFTSVNGSTRNHLVRLDPLGAIDLNFSPSAGANGVVRAIAIQHDGKIVIGGDFTLVNGAPRNGIARLNPNGTLDAGFNPGMGANDSVQALALQSDGRIIAGGIFTRFDGSGANHIVRLLDNGTLDTTFTGTGANEFVSAIALQPDGRILVGGGFTSFNGVPRGGLTRLLADGSTDTSINFGRGANNYVSTIALQTDRKIVIGGGFTQFDGRPRPYIARLNGGENLGPGSLVFSAANYSVIENQTNITITVRRLIGTTNTVTVNFATANGTAIAGTHYTATNGLLSFAPGETIKTFVIRVADDTIINANRTLGLTLSNPTGGASLGTPNTAIVTLSNNDDSLGFNIPFYSVSENTTGAVVTVERLGASVGTVTVNYETFDGTAVVGGDYANSFGTLVFTNGQTVQTFVVPIVNDTLVEGNETLDLVLSMPTGTAILGRQSATLTIVDDDFSSGLLGFTQPVFTVSERGLTAIITVGRGTGSSGAASVDYFTSDGTATAGADYTASSGSLVFADNEFVKTFPIAISDDALVEGPESVNLTLVNPVGAALGQATATLTILGDEALFNFAQPNFFVIESNLFAAITVTRSTDGTGPVSVEFATSNNTAVAGVDFVSTNGLLSWAAGDFTARMFTVQIINDQVGEITEDLRLWLVNPAGESAPGPTNNIPLTILDDDSSFSFDNSSYAVTEGATNATITIVRTGFATGAASVNFATSDGTARAGEDYVFTGVPVNFTNGQTVQTVSVPIIDDALGESDETVNLILQNPSPGTALGTPSAATLTIFENEVVISLAGAAFTVDEAGGNAVITVVRRGLPTGTLSISFATSDGSATAGSDYTATNGVLNFQLFETVQTFNIRILDDAIAEGDETVNVRLFNVAGAAFLVAPTNATLTIVDNDVSFRFSAANYNVGESETNALLTVTRVGAIGPAFQVAYASSDGTAIAGADYAAVTNVLNFGSGQTTHTIAVPILDDLLIEGAQTFAVRLFTPTPTNIVTLGAPSVATVTIVDDDASIIVGAGAALLSESISPANGLVDPGETVNINFGFRNIGNVDTASLLLTLLNTNGVVPMGTSQRNLGVVQAGGPTRTAAFSFMANGTNGGRATATFRVVDGANNLGLVTFVFVLGRPLTSVVNSNSITINDNTIATPYPSTIAVSDLAGSITKVTASLHNINHTFPRDIDILLVGPQGQKVTLISDAGAGFDLNNSTLTFDDEAASFVPESTQIVSGTYRPVNYAGPGTADSFPPPAPGIPYTNAALSTLMGADPNGIWSLFVVDDAVQDGGNIAAGWSLTITTADALAPAADVCITASDSPDPVVIGGDLTYLYRITNFGPSTATGVVFTNFLPAGAQYISSVQSTGGSSTYNPATGTLDCSVGTLASGAGMTITVVVRPTTTGTLTSIASVVGDQADVNPANNTAAVKTTVNTVSLVATLQGANTVMLSWPVDAQGFELQSCDTLPAANWGPAGGTVQVVGGQNRVTLTVTPGERRFFRLRRP